MLFATSVILSALLCGARAGAVGDSSPPVLVSSSFAPLSVDTSSGPVSVTVTAHITDDFSGAGLALWQLHGPNDAFVNASSYVLVSGTALDGVWSATATLPRYAPSGSWTQMFELKDMAGNTRYVFPADTLQVAGGTSPVTLSGVLRDSRGDPLAGLPISLLSSANDQGGTATTGADGSFAVQAPPGSSYLRVDGNGVMAKLNPGIDLGQGSGAWSSDAFDLESNAVENITLPIVSVTVNATDSSSTPIPNAAAGFTGGAIATGPLWAGGPSLHGAIGAQRCCTDATGAVALTMLPSTGNAVIVTPQNSQITGQLNDVSALADTTLDVQIADFAQAVSAGTEQGSLSVSSPEGTSLSDVTNSAVAGNMLPDGETALTGSLGFTLSGVSVGGTADVVLKLPSGSSPTGVYKLTNGSYTDVSSSATISGDAITLHLTDGGTGDEDGTANGSIVDPVIPVRASVPLAPSNTSAVPANQSAIISWTAPANGGSPIAGYSVTPYVGGVAQAPHVFGTATSESITGLTNGKSYTFTVAAMNINGTGAASAPTYPITAGAPSAPSVVSVTAGVGKVSVAYSPSAANGGSAILGYEAKCASSDGGVTKISSYGLTSPLVVSGLSAGHTYTCTVVAKNAVGVSPPSAPSAAVAV